MAKLKTGRHTSAIRESRRALRRKKVNDAWRRRIKAIAKKIEVAVTKKDETTAKQLLKEAFSLLDKAAKKKVIHKNKAANQKSRLSKLYNKSFMPARS